MAASYAAPPVVEGVGDVDAEACPVATSTKDASGVLSSVCPAREVATHTNDASSYDVSAYDVVATPSCATPTMGAPDVPSFICPPMDAAIGCASPVDVVAAPAPLSLTYNTAPAGS